MPRIARAADRGTLIQTRTKLVTSSARRQMIALLKEQPCAHTCDQGTRRTRTDFRREREHQTTSRRRTLPTRRPACRSRSCKGRYRRCAGPCGRVSKHRARMESSSFSGHTSRSQFRRVSSPFAAVAISGESRGGAMPSKFNSATTGRLHCPQTSREEKATSIAVVTGSKEARNDRGDK
jgi:hypothetical protein